MSRPEIILIGNCGVSLTTLQTLQTGLNTTCDALLMDTGRWQKAFAMEVDIAPAEWLLKKSDGPYSEEELAGLSQEKHDELVAKNAVGWLQAMLVKFHAVVAVAASIDEAAACARILKEELPAGFPKLLILNQAGSVDSQLKAGTDLIVLSSHVTESTDSKKVLDDAVAAISSMATVELGRRTEE